MTRVKPGNRTISASLPARSNPMPRGTRDCSPPPDVHLLETQHAEIDKAMTAVMRAIDAGEVSSQATSLAAMLNDISGLVDSHLATEDNELYPILVKSMDPQVGRTARQFRDNKSGIAQEFHGYIDRYKLPDDVTMNAALFRYETRRIFERIRYRMRREENDLYPLLALQGHATGSELIEL
jgi:hemerythrin HHE cation binding domain-containing protein